MERTYYSRLTAAALVAIGFAACSSNSGETDNGMTGADSGFPMDATEEEDTGTADTGPRDVAPRDLGTRDMGTNDTGGGGGDDNESFAEAVTVMFGSGAGVQSVIGTPGDHDFYKVDAPAGSWMLVAATATDPAVTADTVLVLYDSTMTKIAENDDVLFAQTGRTTNSEIVYYVPTAATYYIEVQEFSSWTPMGTSVGGPEYTYRVQALSLLASATGTVIDPEMGNNAMSAVPIEFGRNASFILGTWVDQNDVDVYRVTMTGTELNIFSANVLPDGPEGQGSTSPAGLVWLTDVTGSTITARIDNAVSGSLSVPMTAGDYLLWIAHAPMALGANDYYVVKPAFGGENDPETNDAMNDTLMGAQPIVMQDIDTGLRRGFILSRIGNGDVDYFSFDVRDMEHIGLVCSGRFSGSGARDITGDFRDATDVSVGMATEPADDVLFIEDITVTSTGTYYLRMSKGAQDPQVTSNFARCAVTAFIP